MGRQGPMESVPSADIDKMKWDVIAGDNVFWCGDFLMDEKGNGCTLKNVLSVEAMYNVNKEIIGHVFWKHSEMYIVDASGIAFRNPPTELYKVLRITNAEKTGQ